MPARLSRHLLIAFTLLGGLLKIASASEEQRPELRQRAELLHEVIHGSLQVMHRDFFNEEDPVAIPSASLEDVFEALKERHNVEARWLIVETDAVNVDHKPSDEFEHAAVAALKDGADAFDRVEANAYRYAGAIPLGSQCLKCHVKLRTDNKPRTAGLLLRFPLSEDTARDSD